MNHELREAVEQALSAHLRQPVSIARESVVGGGCINSTQRIITSTGQLFFLKSNPHAPDGMFDAEMEGLNAILNTDTIRVPQPIASIDVAGAGSFIIMEYIQSEPAPGDFAENLGRDLAMMHRHTAGQFGFESDNYIGSTPQANPWSDSWVEFFAESRLGVQLRLIEQRGRATDEMRKMLDKLIQKLGPLIGRHTVRASLVHGDLWSGNIISDEKGNPAIVDPAVYYGDREVDLAMTELFGRLDPKFYAAYQEVYPLEEGYEERRDIYNLYHLMNHLNIFGLSYMSGVMDILRRYH